MRPFVRSGVKANLVGMFDVNAKAKLLENSSFCLDQLALEVEKLCAIRVQWLGGLSGAAN